MRSKGCCLQNHLPPEKDERASMRMFVCLFVLFIAGLNWALQMTDSKYIIEVYSLVRISSAGSKAEPKTIPRKTGDADWLLVGSTGKKLSALGKE